MEPPALEPVLWSKGNPRVTTSESLSTALKRPFTVKILKEIKKKKTKHRRGKHDKAVFCHHSPALPPLILLLHFTHPCLTSPSRCSLAMQAFFLAAFWLEYSCSSALSFCLVSQCSDLRFTIASSGRPLTPPRSSPSSAVNHQHPVLFQGTQSN
ncbi:unnamed protein product [Rangifer tarandus platyrhynchus]|uniref:Uncharacterized protein n=1 Tax=Rangifer tarandus platyrhynchus TaxID=3082113 RepID=A0AC59ZQF8_RANTA